jgi:hypothetical protein
MGKLVYFVAGVSVDVLPAKHIKSVLLNVPDNGRDEKAIKDARNLVRISRAKTVMLDSGGFQLLQAEKRGLGIGYDETGPIRQEGKINLTPWHVVKELAPRHNGCPGLPHRHIRRPGEAGS